MKAYSAPGRIDVKGKWDFFVRGTFIYWLVTQDSMELGYRMPSDQTIFTGDVIRMDFNFKPGLKTGVGMYFPCDNWELYGEYTGLWFKNNETQGYLLASNGIQPCWLTESNISPQGEIRSVKGHWDVDMHLGDLTLGRFFYSGKKLILYPYIGARGGAINQIFVVTYNETPTNGASTYVDVANRFTQKGWLLGSRAGLDSDYHIGKGFRLSGRIAFSLLYQYFKAHMNETYRANTDASWRNFIMKQKHVTLNPETYLGLGWGSYFLDQKWNIDILLRYDFQVFFNQNIMKNLVDRIASAETENALSTNLGDLYMHGLTLCVKLDF